MKRVYTSAWLSGAVYLTLLALSTTPALATDAPTGGAEIGVNINHPSVNIAGTTNLSVGTKAGLLFGFFAQLPINKMLDIQPEFLYSRKPFGISATDPGGSFSTNINASYFQIPILARINARRFYGIVGPGLGVRIQADQSDTIENGVRQPDESLNGELKRLDVSIILGGGITVGKMDFEGRYDHGLRELSKDTTEFSTKSRTLSFIFRVRFK